MLVGLWQHHVPVDLILFADPGAEQPHTYHYLRIMDQWLREHGMPGITRVCTTDRQGQRLTLEQECLRSASLPAHRAEPRPRGILPAAEGPDLREATYDLAGTSVRCAVVSGLGNTRKLLEAVRAGRVHYALWKSWPAPGGCAGRRGTAPQPQR